METESDNFNQLMWIWKLQVCLLAVQVVRVKRLVEKRAYVRRSRPVGRKWTYNKMVKYISTHTQCDLLLFDYKMLTAANIFGNRSCSHSLHDNISVFLYRCIVQTVMLLNFLDKEGYIFVGPFELDRLH